MNLQLAQASSHLGAAGRQVARGAQRPVHQAAQAAQQPGGLRGRGRRWVAERPAARPRVRERALAEVELAALACAQAPLMLVYCCLRILCYVRCVSARVLSNRTPHEW